MRSPSTERRYDAVTRAMADRINHTQEVLLLSHLDRIATALERLADKKDK